MSDDRSDRVRDPSGPPTLSLALSSLLGAALADGARTGLLTIVRPAVDGEPEGAERIVVPFPGPRRPLDDGPGGDGPSAA